MPTIPCRALLLAFALWSPFAAAEDGARQEMQEAGSTPEGEAPTSPGSAGPDPLIAAPEAAEYEPPASVRDPLEPTNRAFFGLNGKLDDWFWSPLTRAYRFVAPEPARRGIRRAIRNLNTPIFFVNNLLQLRLRDAGETLGAFVLNSTLGIVGFLEPSKEAGWEARPADFGQTLDLAGVGSGPYLVLPIFGPTTVRDGLGSVVDHFFQPLSYVIPIVPTQLLWGGGVGLSMREESSDELEALRESSVDFYAVMRSAFMQNREQEAAEARRRRDAGLDAMLPRSWRCEERGPSVAQD